MSASPASPRLVVTPEGWIVESLHQFRHLVDHTPPRPYPYGIQVKRDAGDWKCVAIWIVGIVLLAVGAAIQMWLLLVLGALVLLFYLRVLHETVIKCRTRPLCVAKVSGVRPPTGLLRVTMATVRLQDGRQVQVALLPGLASAIKQLPAEVMFLDMAKEQYSLATAVRPVARPTNVT